jgi:sirohydrochlorin ferrochelatase
MTIKTITTAFAAATLIIWQFAAPAWAADSTAEAQTDHSAHTGHSTARDDKGRRLYGMKHEMTPEMIAELREKVSVYESYSDAEMALSMEMMGGDYEWFISDYDLRGDQGLLILMHGFREHGDAAFRQSIQPMADIFPTVMAAGMAMHMSQHIQLGIDDLEAAGAKTIVVVPVVSTTNNEMMRQWEYIFGLRDEAAFVTVPQVTSNAKILIIDPPGSDPLVAEILLDRANEISTDPSKEFVIIAAHGPSEEADNLIELKQLEYLAALMREDGDFADVIGITLQDDAETAVRAANVEKLRAAVTNAQSKGQTVLIVTNLIGSRTIQAKLRKDLKGLDYKFNAKGIAQHDNFIKWMGDSVREEFESVETAQNN